jgi:hypothetical protein
MYSNPHGSMPPPQSRSVAPETFLLDQDAQQSLPPDSIVALQQVDNREFRLSRKHSRDPSRCCLRLMLTRISQILPHLCAG